MAIAALYVALAPSHVEGADNSELATLGAVGGIAHPSGYPSYVLWLRAWSWLPGTPAHAAALATVILAIACVCVLYAACRAWGARPWPAVAAVALFATGPIVLRVHTEAEVFAPNALVAAAVLWLAAERGPLRGAWRGLALGLVAGLGLANHLSCALVAPVGILGVVRATREARIAPVAALGGLVLGLATYLYLLVAPATLLWGPIDGVSALVHHALRLDYGGPGAFSSHGDHVGIAANLGELAATIGRAYWYVPAIAGVAMLVGRTGRPEGETRAAWLALAASFLLAGPLLAARFDVPLVGRGLFVVQRFHLLPVLLLAIPVARVFDRIFDRLAPIVAIAALVAPAASSLAYVRRGHSPAVEHFGENMLAGLPPAAVVIVADSGGWSYAQRALGDRPDVTVVMWPMIPVPSYRARIASALGLVLPEQGDAHLGALVADQLLAQHRPLFVDGFEAGILAAYPTVPHGIVFDVRPKGSQLPPIADVVAANKALFADFALDDDHELDYAAAVFEQYARTWRILGDALAAAGKRDEAESAYELARSLAN